MYNQAANEGIRCIYEIISSFFNTSNTPFEIHRFLVRSHNEFPDLSFDAYISSGGPGSPLIEVEPWIAKYEQWLQELQQHHLTNKNPKPTFFICYSFQLSCRFFHVGEISQRHHTSFGIFPIKINQPNHDLFKDLPDAFPAFDNRDFQVTLANKKSLGSETIVLASEHTDSHDGEEPAVMAIQFNEFMWGTQFHPEADSGGMLNYLNREERKKQITALHGQEKWEHMIRMAENPSELQTTRDLIVPNFLQFAMTCKNKGL